MELFGIEQYDLPYARAVGYLGAGRTPIGPGGPRGEADTTPLGWQETVGTPAAAPGAVGYVNPARVGQGATTDPAELVRPPESGFSLRRFLADLEFTPATVQRAAPFTFGPATFRLAPLGQRRGY